MISVNMKSTAGASGGGEDKRLKKNCEYILLYAKNYSSLPMFNAAYEYTDSIIPVDAEKPAERFKDIVCCRN